MKEIVEGSPLATLTRRIEEAGPIGFDEFMAIALYGPGGYYRGKVPGDSDYRTGPSQTEWFGKMVGRGLARLWRSLGQPDRFTVAEVGPGRGDLAASALESATGKFGEALRWCLIEPFEAIAQRQRQRLAGVLAQVEWTTSLDELAPFEGVVLANEVLDNFPCRLFEVTEEGVIEIGVGMAGEELCEISIPLDEPVDETFRQATGLLEPGDRFETRTLDRFCRQVARCLSRGFFLVIDYGETEPEIWTRYPVGTIATYREERLGFDALAEVGRTDITAHVDFSALERSARATGLAPSYLQSQRDWLLSLGLEDVIEELREAEQLASAQGRHADWLGLVSERSRVVSLAARGGFGSHLVFLAASHPDLTEDAK